MPFFKAKRLFTKDGRPVKRYSKRKGCSYIISRLSYNAYQYCEGFSKADPNEVLKEAEAKLGVECEWIDDGIQEIFGASAFTL